MLAEQQLVCGGGEINEEKHNNLSQVRIFCHPFSSLLPFESDAVSIGTNGCFCCCAGLFSCALRRTPLV